MRLLALTLAFALFAPLYAQNADFSVTLKRTSCLGFCPEYEVTIWGNGRVRYEGHYYVRIEGVRKRTIPISDAQKLLRRLQDLQFFQWEEAKGACLDLPEVHITASLGSQRRHVLEGCNQPGKILDLAEEIDKIAGTERWVNKSR